MIWNLKELQENANTVAGNKQVKDLLADYYYDDIWFYFYDQEKQVKYVSEVSSLCDWNVYALLKAGHAYAITEGDEKYLAYCYDNVASSDGFGASYSGTLITFDLPKSFDFPKDIFNDENILSQYVIPNISKIEDLGENSIAKDLVSLASMHESGQKSYFNPEYELLGRYKGYHYSHINIRENAIKIFLSGKDKIGLSVIELFIEDYLVALAETEGYKQLDLAFKDYGISYKLEINK